MSIIGGITVAIFAAVSQVNQSPTHTVLRTAVVSNVASGTSLQPQRSVFVNPLNSARRPVRCADANTDLELPSFMQERLEDGNARRVCTNVALCKRV